MNRIYLWLPAALLLTLALAARPVAAQTWSGGGADNNWSTVANWSGGAPPSNSATAVTFAGGNRLAPFQNIANPFTLNSLTFSPSAGAFTLGGNGLNFAINGSILPTLTQGSNNSVFAGSPIILTNNLTVGGSGTGGLTLDGAVTGVGSLTLTGGYTLTLSGAGSSFSGGLNVNGGTVDLGGTLTTAPPPSRRAPIRPARCWASPNGLNSDPSSSAAVRPAPAAPAPCPSTAAAR